jgi:hypothetical protein
VKRCPACSRIYQDESLAFCLEDGKRLLNLPQNPSDAPTLVLKTNMIPDQGPTVVQQDKTVRAGAVLETRVAFPQPEPKRPPPEIHEVGGRGLAAMSVLAGLLSFFSLVVALVSSALRLSGTLTGLSFLAGVPIGVIGTIFGIVAVALAVRHPVKRGGKGLAVTGAIICILYLLSIGVVFLGGIIANLAGA